MNDISMTRQDGVALWRQIADTLRREIGAGTPAPGAQLPTEAGLAARFGVNRHTVRRAIEELARGGMIRVEQGRGSFVAEDVIDYTVASRTRFSEWIRRHNKEPSGRVLQLRELAAEPAIAASLNLRSGGKVVLLERLGLADGRPVSLTSHYFPAARLRGVQDALSRFPSITEALASVGVTDYLRRSSRIGARMPSAEEAELLKNPRSRPLLVAENVNVDSTGRVVEFGVGRYPTPRVQIVFEP